MSNCETVIKTGTPEGCTNYPGCGCPNPPKNSMSSCTSSGSTGACTGCRCDCKAAECKC
ncbi:hypothetical protein M407DRAFT_241382 [Tulasnella calospora MUT 4182]|uniref:Metallothionein n=1 Tax=Tulasnella calospora MUT 4182 TaxID=1051891 RepID=A0A0C3MFH8_9AGAM|nr:hypothetical protein M407DRAFT_241382 [Tulasnella calospora MUT 4182]